MPSNDSNSTLASKDSTSTSTSTKNQVIPTEPRVASNHPIRKPPVIIHNKGGQTYDETRPSDWDKQRWK